MLATVAKRIFGSANDRYVAKLGRIVETINAFEPTIAAMTDDELRGQTERFRQRLAEGAKLDDLLPEACVRRPSGRSASAITMCR